MLFLNFLIPKYEFMVTAISHSYKMFILLYCRIVATECSCLETEGKCSLLSLHDPVNRQSSVSDVMLIPLNLSVFNFRPSAN